MSPRALTKAERRPRRARSLRGTAANWWYLGESCIEVLASCREGHTTGVRISLSTLDRARSVLRRELSMREGRR